MKVIKVKMEGITTSFRYPHFLIEKQPTYRMPPPATIYGHICSALGEFVDPVSIRFGYYFNCEGRGKDYEHIHKIEASSGKLDRKWGYVKNIEVEVDPLLREILLFPKLTLYVDAPHLIDRLYNSFLAPCYPVLLGRSQDLAGYRRVVIIKLQISRKGYYEGTLLPWSFRARTGAAVSVLMPRFICPEDRRNVKWGRFLILKHRIFYGLSGDSASNMLRFEGDSEVFIDPESQEIEGLNRIILWHNFTEEEESIPLGMARSS